MTTIDSLIQKYLQGVTTEEENLLLFEWIKQSPENEKRLFGEKDIWDVYGFKTNQKEYDSNIELDVLKKQLIPQKSSRLIRFGKLLKIAAILLITFGLGWSSQFLSHTEDTQKADVATQDIFVPKGQINQIFLADGTRIWINSESRLTVPLIFSQNERIVKLSGEAFFEVAKDKKHPFIVDVNGQRIKVLGTSFNVRAYDTSNKIETTLETGEIKLFANGQTTVLKPGDQCLYNKENNKLIVSTVEPEAFSTWKDGRFEFKNENLTEVFKIVERWYDVEISADENYFKNMHFSGVIKRNKDTKHFLELLNNTVPIAYEINADKIKIYPRKNNTIK